MMIRLTPIVFLAFAACTVPVAPPQPDPVVLPQSAKERFVRAAEENGCVVDETNSAKILAGAVLSVEDLARIMTELRAEGRGDITNGGKGFRVKSAACP